MSMHRIVKPHVHIYKVDKNKTQSFFDKVHWNKILCHNEITPIDMLHEI